MNAAAYRKAIDQAITIATEPSGNSGRHTFESQMCVFAGALIGGIDNGDPALARRIKLFTDSAIKANRAVAPSTEA